MNKKALLIILLLLVFLGIGAYKLLSSTLKAPSGLRVVANTVSSVFVNEKLAGKTPYEGDFPAGEYNVKLIADDTGNNFVSWEGKIKLQSSLQTYIKRDLGTSDLTSGGEIVSLEKITLAEAQMAVISAPDGTSVTLDGADKGNTPLFIRDVPEGEHDITISTPGFLSRTLRVATTNGYKLTVTAALAMSGTNTPLTSFTPPPIITQTDKTSVVKVLIKDTPTGFLRVRSGPSLGASESAQIKPGQKFPFVEEKAGWMKITYEEGKDGWISGQYASKLTE